MKLNLNFTSKIILIIVIVFTLDFIFGIVLEKLYSRTKTGLCQQENYIMLKTKQPLLIFGSSRAEYHYNPDIISNSTGLSTYNCGREGVWLYYHYGVLLSTLKRYHPKIVILEIDLKDIYENKADFGKGILVQHAPYYKRISNEFDSLLELNGIKETIKMQSFSYRYNSKFFKIITGNLVSKDDSKNGFKSQNGIWTKKIEYLNSNNEIVDNEKINTINNFIYKAKSNNVKLFFAISPYYKIVPTNILNPIKTIAERNDITLLNHLSDTIFMNDNSLFYDDLHLNKRGAELYSMIIANEVKKILEK